jgi:hypothetical protein
MHKKRSRFALLGILTLAFTVTAGLTLSDVASAQKKKKGGGGTKTISKAGGPIPDPFFNPTPSGNGGSADFHAGILASKIQVGRKFQSAKIKDLNVQVSASHASIAQLAFQLIGPNGQMIILSAGNDNKPAAPGPFVPSTVFGPTTFDDQAASFIDDTNSCPNDTDLAPATCAGPPPSPDGGGVEARPPYAGNFKPQDGTLASLGSKLQGSWVLLAFDTTPAFAGAPPPFNGVLTGSLTNWRLIAQLKGGKKKKK